eukprot:TRINITY_DN852_c0_g2_i1.p1 TRINITY_DN852_c0_g2~~TRINITY_DN852_c0_g2_i1.p1  ORF type:complete len:367 (+),score=64.92 TRINITY_DN852_c0_g2_i1:36-1103(+)
MRSATLAVLLLLSASVLVSCESDELLFRSFVQRHHKWYGQSQSRDDSASSEYAARYEVFRGNLQRIAALNAESQSRGSSVVYGVTRFADLSPAEFAALYSNAEHGAKLVEEFEHAVAAGAMHKSNETASPVAAVSALALPTDVDWRAKGAVTDVKNQGQCGCCWTFSTVANIESLYKIKYNQLIDFSPQQLIDCDHTCKFFTCNKGCSGGVPKYAMEYIKKNGLTTLKKYPFIGKEGTCSYTESMSQVTIKDFVAIDNDEGEMQKYVANSGPISACLYVNSNFQYYKSGVFDDAGCPTNTINHAITVVGYGTENGKDFWIIKNSWGDDWGEDGFIRIARGKNMCGIKNQSATAVL